MGSPATSDNHQGTSPLYVQVCVSGVALDKALAWGYLVAHEHRKNFVSFNCFFNGHFEDGALIRVHCGVPEGIGVHFTKTFITANFWLFPIVRGFVFDNQSITLFLGIDEAYLFAELDMINRKSVV